jgi:predicted ATP-dependent serine protease
MQFEELNFTDKWLKFMGKPCIPFKMMVHGQPGSGKTVFLLKFAQYLALNFGKVLYVSSEEYATPTLSKKLNDFKIIAPGLSFCKDITGINFSEYQFVFVDSISPSHIAISAKNFQDLKASAPMTSFILILQSNKDGNFKGDKDWEHEVDIVAVVSDRVATITKNRYGRYGIYN